MGDVLEKKLGKIRYLFIYFGGGIAGNCLSVYMDLQKAQYPVSAGASGAIFAVIGAILWLIIKNKGRLGDISGRKFVLMIVLSVFQGYTSIGVDNAAHIGGLVIGFFLCMILSIGVKESEDEYLTYD